MALAYLSLGGNIGAVQRTLSLAVAELKALPVISSFRCSPIYQTEPVAPAKGPAFLNCVCSFETELSARALLLITQEIEKRFGKVPKAKSAPRPIDIDLILVGDEKWIHKQLTLPHPCWQERLFVVRPLADLVDTVEVPGEGKVHLKTLLNHLKRQEQGVSRNDK